jgi:hypothetical protein
MKMRYTVPKQVVVDFSPLFYELTDQFSGNFITNHLPIRDIVQIVLSVNPYNDHGEHFYNELDSRLLSIDQNVQLDFDVVTFMLDSITEATDQHLQRCLKGIDATEYTFCTWHGHSTAILTKDENGTFLHNDVPFSDF